MMMYHGGNWVTHQGGLNGLLQAYSSRNPSAALSHGKTPNVVNLTSDYDDAVDWMMSYTSDLGEPGIVYAVDFARLDESRLRPIDICGPNATVDSSLADTGCIAYEGPIDREILWVEKHQIDDEPERFTYKSPEHIAAMASEIDQ